MLIKFSLWRNVLNFSFMFVFMATLRKKNKHEKEMAHLSTGSNDFVVDCFVRLENKSEHGNHLPTADHEARKLFVTWC